jgi:hypothetical protein
LVIEEAPNRVDQHPRAQIAEAKPARGLAPARSVPRESSRRRIGAHAQTGRMPHPALEEDGRAGDAGGLRHDHRDGGALTIGWGLIALKPIVH